MTETHNDPEELARRVASLSAQNERLAQILVEARSKIVGLQQQIDDLAQPPSTYATFIRSYSDGTADVMVQGRKMRLTSLPAAMVSTARPGQQVRLNEAMAIVETMTYDHTGVSHRQRTDRNTPRHGCRTR